MKNMTIASFFLLFPIVFMLHELEEIALMPDWIHQQKKKKQVNKLVENLPETSARSFSLMVLEEYLLLLLMMGICWYFSFVSFYAAVIIAYNLHIIVHVAQSLCLKTYVPGLFLGIISFGVNSLLLSYFSAFFELKIVIFCVPIALIVLIGNLFLIHKWIK
ncbi:HXXEE domain-containing protein [Enterococcus sp. LJL99]